MKYCRTAVRRCSVPGYSARQSVYFQDGYPLFAPNTKFSVGPKDSEFPVNL